MAGKPEIAWINLGGSRLVRLFSNQFEEAAVGKYHAIKHAVEAGWCIMVAVYKTLRGLKLPPNSSVVLKFEHSFEVKSE